MSLLDDPTLRLRPTRVPPAAGPSVGQRVRFQPTSAFASNMGLPIGAQGVVTARYDHGGRDVLNVQCSKWFATGVPAGEVEPLTS